MPCLCPGPCHRLSLPALLVAILPSFLASQAGAEEADDSLLTLERIYASGELHARRYSARWEPEGSRYLRLETSAGPDGGQEMVRYSAADGAREVIVPSARIVPPGESRPLDIDDYAWSRDGSRVLLYTSSRRVWRRNTRGDYWVLDLTARELRQVAPDARPSSLMFAKLSPDGGKVAYVRDNDIHVEDLRERRTTRLTTGGNDDIINGTFDWVYEEELGLRDGFRWSPDGRRIAYWQLDTRGVREFHLIRNTDALYPEIQTIRYPKAGETNSACRVGVVPSAGGDTRWIDLPGDPRHHYVARMDWAASSDEILIQQLNRLQNANRLFLADVRTGEVRLVLTEEDEAWVDVHDELRWLEGGRTFTWISERDGWRHVYLVSRDGARIRCVTPGEYDVIELLGIDEERGWAYFLASPEDPTSQYLYRTSLDPAGGPPERVTPEERRGTSSYRISADFRWAIHEHSSGDRPPILELVELPSHETARALEDNSELREKLGKLRRASTEFFRVDIGDDVTLDAWCIRPPDLDPGKKYPLLVYVYGEPAGQTVRDRWGGSGYLWHLMLAQRGYLVMSFDNRGTPAPRGRAWRKCVYRKIGILAPADQAAAVEAVRARYPYVDRSRVGIWGWSGGGSMSLNAIFRYPDLYGTAMAVAPVSNQRHYDTIYQERYMGLPSDNVEGFEQGSPITHAHRLQGNLLIVHGTGDDNVHYQGTEALVNELVRHDKAFTAMAYPNRSHGIHEGANTSLHLRRLLTRYLLEHLPPGPAPVEATEGPPERSAREPKRGKTLTTRSL